MGAWGKIQIKSRTLVFGSIKFESALQDSAKKVSTVGSDENIVKKLLSKEGLQLGVGGWL